MIYNSFEKIYEDYFGKIYNFIFGQMLNREISEDLTEDVFVKVMTNLDSYNPSRGGDYRRGFTPLPEIRLPIIGRKLTSIAKVKSMRASS